MSSQLDAEVVVGIGGVVVACGVIVLWFSWNHSARVGGAYHVEEHGVWQWMVRAGAGGRRVWMMVVMWKGCGIRI